MNPSTEIKDIEQQISLLNKKLESLTRQQNKIIVGIISCLKNHNKMETIRQTWVLDLKKNGIDYFFVIGDSTLTKPIVKGDILFVPTKDYYENLPEKVTLFYEYIYDNTDYKYIFKIDDDCYLNTNNLFKTKFWDYDYLGKVIGLDPSGLLPDWHFGKCDDPKLNGTPYWKKHEGPWCGGGYGYFLSRKAMKVIKDNKKEVIEDLYEDKAIGDILRKNGILPAGNEIYKPLNPFEYNINISETMQFNSLIDDKIGEKIFDYSVVMEIRNKEIMHHIHDIFLNPLPFIEKQKLNKTITYTDYTNKTNEALKLLNDYNDSKNLLKEREVQIEKLNKENTEQKASIQWYKDTFENRGLFGVIKEKLLNKHKQ